ncbi:MAG TPA: hypothetical protein VGM56_27400 [Byssovorax sp.]|jgi:hypothetical protein
MTKATLWVLRAIFLCAPMPLAISIGCSPVDTGFETVVGPPFGADGGDFAPVSNVMEQRCGTLDCHGQMARPLRIVGGNGLRLAPDGGAPIPPDSGIPVPAANLPGAPDTFDELLSNYASMVGLQPEIMAQVDVGAAPTDDLRLVRKPRLEEKHKGGKIWAENDPGDRCLNTWLTAADAGDVDTGACSSELSHP